MSYLDNEFFLLAVTFGVFFFSKLLQKKTGILLLNPHFADYRHPDYLSENGAYQLRNLQQRRISH